MSAFNRRTAVAALGLSAVTTSIWANAPVLTITQAQAPETSLSLETLLALPQHSFKTKTPWYPEPVVFSGPLLRDVLKAAGVTQGQRISAVALDEYKVLIPFSDATQFDVILAHRLNGQALTRRDKGPLFVVYPFDSDPALQSVKFYERSIWQLRTLHIQ